MLVRRRRRRSSDLDARPGDRLFADQVEHVLDAVVETAARFCGAQSVAILRPRASDGRLAACAAAGQLRTSSATLTGPTTSSESLVRSRAVRLLRGAPSWIDGRSPSTTWQRPSGPTSRPLETIWRAGECGPMSRCRSCRAASRSGSNVSRLEVRRFTEREIALLKAFADQAVWIENARLFQALQERTAEPNRSVDELRALGEVSFVFPANCPPMNPTVGEGER